MRVSLTCPVLSLRTNQTNQTLGPSSYLCNQVPCPDSRCSISGAGAVAGLVLGWLEGAGVGPRGDVVQDVAQGPKLSNLFVVGCI